MRFQHRVALLTGAQIDYGEVIASQLAEEGAELAVLATTSELPGGLVHKLKESGARGIAYEADLTNKEEVELAVNKVVAHYGRIDILINNASTPHHALLSQVDEETLNRLIDITVKSYFVCAQAVIPHMQNRRYGKVVNIASASLLGADSRSTLYTASQAAILGLTRSLALEAGAFNINVNAVAPGVIEGSTLASKLAPDSREHIIQRTPLLRLGAPQDVANAVLFLASDKASYITGQCLFVCGGRSLGRLSI